MTKDTLLTRIASYYPATDTETYQQLSEEEKTELDYDIALYHKTINDTVIQAQKSFIEKWTARNTLYSKTWK